LFLGTLAEVRVQVNDSKRFERVIGADWSRDGEVTMRVKECDLTPQCLRYRVFSSDLPVDSLEAGCEPRNVQVAVEVTPEPDRPTRATGEGLHPMYTYYPLADEGRLLPILIHGEFEVDPGRMKFSADAAHDALNRFLLDGIVDLIAGAVDASGSASVLDAVIDGSLDARHA